MARRRPDTRAFRPEIEGLRAIAAILVAVYHIWFAKVSGGVDVFFVIAGFLITTSLLRQVQRTGRLDVGRFLTRLGKRLLPASLTVLAAVLVATRVLMPFTREEATYLEVVASALYLENWALAAKSVDYLARDEPSSPVQHFWAMSIQGQFYLLWIVVFGVALALRRREVQRSLGWVLTVLFAASSAFSVYLTAANQPLAYFHTGTRVWEFAAGGLLALVISRVRRMPDGWGALASWVGLAMIVLTGVILPVSDAFPGVVAAWPIAGAVLVLLGSGAQSALGADRLLTIRPLVKVGGIAYGLYLWHWPILTFYLLWSGESHAGFLAGMAILATSFALAEVTTRFVETPVRSGQVVERGLGRVLPLRSWTFPVAGATAMALVAGVGVAASSRVGQGVEDVTAGIAVEGDHPGAAVMVGGRNEQDYSTGPVPSLAEAAEDRAKISRNGCQQALENPELKLCEYGDPTSATTVMLVGGSHSTHWFPALEPIAEEHGWRLVTATKSSCLFSTDPPGGGTQLESCMAWNEALLDLMVQEQPSLVVMTSTRGQGPEEHVPDGYVDMWLSLGAAGVEVAAIRDTPRFESSRVECLAQHGLRSDACNEPRELHLADVDPTAALESRLSNVTFIDLNDYFCDHQCYAVIGNVVVYFDGHHITASYARTLTPMLDAALRGIVD